MADLMTFEEHRGRLPPHCGVERDDNNVLASWRMRRNDSKFQLSATPRSCAEQGG